MVVLNSKNEAFVRFDPEKWLDKSVQEIFSLKNVILKQSSDIM